MIKSILIQLKILLLYYYLFTVLTIILLYYVVLKKQKFFSLMYVCDQNLLLKTLTYAKQILVYKKYNVLAINYKTIINDLKRISSVSVHKNFYSIKLILNDEMYR